jgi:membrane-associated phospholipid phosphatase
MSSLSQLQYRCSLCRLLSILGLSSPTQEQIYCQTQLLNLRLPGAYTFRSQGAGIVSFPSFHVIWAVLCARALWGFRYLRIPVTVLSGMIILSTLTTGWRYLSDVIAGAIVAGVSIICVRSNRREISRNVDPEVEFSSSGSTFHSA